MVTKLCFKYGALLLLAFWFSCLMGQAMDICYTGTPLVMTTPQFEILQNNKNHKQAIENLANRCANMSCDKVDFSTSNVPVAKYILRFVGIYKEFCPENIHSKKAIQHNFTTYLSDPNIYYIFGLRRIII